LKHHATFLGIAAGLVFSVAPLNAAETYKFDQGHTEIMFGWSHAGVSMQHGKFRKADGTLILDPENVENSKTKSV